MEEGGRKFITVVISTRNRGDDVVRAVETILSNNYPDYEVIIVDQSDDALTETSLHAFQGHPRLRYLKSATKGVSTGRNLGISTASSELIAITDDDCETRGDWLQELSAAFEVDGRIGVVFGNVLPDAHDPTAGFIPAYVRREPFLARGVREKHKVEGISACMGLRKSVWQRLSGFDQMLGAGAPFKSAAETDFAVRTLQAGYFVYETPRVAVTHRGFRTWEQGGLLIQGYLFGIGAMLVKHLKCGRWSVVQVLLQLARRWAFGRPVVDLGDRPHRFLRLKAFVRGFVAGATTSVNKATGHYASGN